MALNGEVLHNGGENQSPIHGSAKYISPHIGNINRGDSIDLISRKGGSSMDQQRKTHIAYEYLCHLEETKKWLEACIEEELPVTTELEEALRTGVILCKLGHWYAPEVLPVKKIYDLDGSKFKMKGLHFKHTDNFNFWLKSMRHIGLPEIFYPETTDLYDKKNMPRVIYCIHALSLLLYRLGKAPEIEDLVGEATFTEEEITAVKTELDKYGINMPAFGKIGGILANELSVDEAAIHAAVLAINEVLENDDHSETLKKLQNPMAVLKEVEEANAERYQKYLKKQKESKGLSHAQDVIEDSDAYDFLLTQSEIQSCIEVVNTEVTNEMARAKLETAIQTINSAIDSNSMTSLLRALQSEDSNLIEVDPQNVRWYQDILEKTKKDHEEGSEEELDLTHDEIQDIILMANQIAEHTRLVEAAVLNINCVLQSEGDASELVEGLQNEYISLSAVSPSNVHYYYQGLRESLNRKRQESGNPSCLLTENEIQEMIHQCNNTADYDNKVIHTFEAINQAVEGDDHDQTMTLLQSQYADIADIDETMSPAYHEALKQRRLEKGEELAKEEIIEVVAEVNEQVKLERLLGEGVAAINASVSDDGADHHQLLQLLNNQYIGLERVVPNNAPHYATLLAATGKTNLSKAEIQAVIDKVNSQTQEAVELAQGVCAINESLASGDSSTTLATLKAAGLRSITDACATTYHEKLCEAVDETDGELLEWVEHRSRDGHTYYYNKTTEEVSWIKPDSTLSSKDLSREKIQTVVTKVTADYDRWALLQSNEPTIIFLQSWWRGALIRKAYLERVSYLKSHEKEAIKIQAQWKGLRQRRAYRDRLQLLQSNIHLIIKIQSLVKMYLARKRHRERLKYFQNNVEAIVKIQAFWRAKKTKKDYKQLVEVTQPPASAVRKFLSLLEQSGLDFSEEIECQRLKSQVVQQIRSNQQLEHDLNVMDIKIGLLVRNRISLQDVVSQSDQIKRNRRRKHHTGDPDDDVTALGGMSKTNQEKIEAYQHLFYLLQTNPHYFASLVFAMSPNKTNQFMENVILSVLNYAQNNREQYLLVRLFETALTEEINEKVFAIKDIITGNPTVIKMVIHYTRSDTSSGQSVLRDLLHPLVQDIIGQEDLVLNISPVDVYKAWINQMESETGEKSKLPYEVSNDDALQHDEVKRRIAQTIQVLIDATEKFQNTIMASVNRIPYAMRYIAMRLRQALLEKFPDTAEDDVLKVVGNLLYYRYMNPAIVAPDAFDIIDMGVDKRILETEQRRNLGAIAKVLQHAAAGKLFEGENAALSSMNGYIQKAFEKFKEFFLAASTVQSPAEKFGYNEYTDVIMLTKPVIYITVKELLRTHTLLVEHEEALAPEQDDPLREILKDLGSIPTVEQLLGGVREPLPTEEKDDVIDEASKQELALTLSNKFEVVQDDGSDMKALFVRTKRMIVDLLKVQPGDNITQVLYTPATVEQEDEHQKLIQQRQQADKDKLNISATLATDSTFTERDLPLEGMKRKIMRQLRTLEQEEMVSSKDDYQEIINAIARDIRNQHRHRQQRKQELRRLQETLEKLNQKSHFFEEQVEYYQQYVKACLESLAKAGGKGGPAGPEFKRQSIKYTAHRLHEKGVVLEIEGLPKHQFKNATIEITATEAGMFEVTGRVMGMTFEKVELVFQDLLQLQYEGVAVMKMFGRAKINVNLLIYLINKKFYGKG